MKTLPLPMPPEETAYTSKTLPFDPTTALSDLTSIETLDLGKADPVSVTIAIINALLTLLGIAFLVLLLYAGVLWVVAKGNEEQIEKAKTILKRALFGLIIIISAYGISFLTFVLITAYTETTT